MTVGESTVTQPVPSDGPPVVAVPRRIAGALARPHVSPRFLIGGLLGIVLFAILTLYVGLAAASLGLCALGGAVLAFSRPELIGPAVVLLVPAGYRVRVFDADVSVLEAVVGGTALGYVGYLVARSAARRLTLAHVALGVFVVLVMTSALGPASASAQLRRVLFWGALAFVFHAVTTYVRDQRVLRLFLLGLVLATSVEVVLTFYDYAVNWPERFHRLGGSIVYPLPTGTMWHANALAQFLVLAILTLVALALAERGLLARLSLGVAAAGSLALVVTFSRASWVAFAAGASVFLFERRARRPVLLIGGGAVMTGAALALLTEGAVGARVSSIFTGVAGGLSGFRYELAERAVSIAADHPLTGVGTFAEFGTYAGRQDFAAHPHNLFLGLAVFFGVPAAVAFASVVGLAVRAAATGAHDLEGREHLRAVGLLAVIVAFLVNGLFEYPLWSAPLTTMVVLVLGAVIALDPRPRRAVLLARRR